MQEAAIESVARRCSATPRRDRHQRAFTLIELLVVIAIIALLVSILMPSLAKAKELGKSAACAANEHTMGLGVAFYANDYSGALPWTYCATYDAAWYKDPGNIYYGKASWATLMYPYSLNADVYGCPAHTQGDGKPAYGVDGTTGRGFITDGLATATDGNWPGLHYSANPYLGWSAYGPGGNPSYNPLNAVDFAPGGTFTPVLVDKIKSAASKVYAFDKKWAGLAYSATPATGRAYFTVGDVTDSSKYNPWYNMANIGTSHMKKSNFVFMDGHAETVQAQDRRSFGDTSSWIATDGDATYWRLN